MEASAEEYKEEDVKSSTCDFEDFPRVTFLGTGASIPSKYRCVSSILVRTSPSSCHLLDCGEGTYQQMTRNMGVEEADEVLAKKLKFVYVSHLHADHHLGLLNLLLKRLEALKKMGVSPEEAPTLYLVAPGRIAHFLTSMHDGFEPALSGVRLANCAAFLVDRKKIVKEDKERKNNNVEHKGLSVEEKALMLNSCDLINLETCFVDHCAGSFGVSMVHKSGYKVVYSGDTRPTEKLVNLGKRGGVSPDLLIHEATMCHDLLQDAVLKRHSTFTEAMDVADQMGAKFTMLTHFSQRYSKVPLLDEFKDRENVGVAFDHLTVSPSTLNLSKISAMAEQLKVEFEEEIRLMESRRLKQLSKEEDPEMGGEDEDSKKSGLESKKPKLACDTPKDSS